MSGMGESHENGQSDVPLACPLLFMFRARRYPCFENLLSFSMGCSLTTAAPPT